MLHSIDEGGNIQWDCHNPYCPHHHCAGRDEHTECPAHNEKVVGIPHQAHISHEGVQYTSDRLVQLPPCRSCGSQMTVAVQFSEKELAPPTIERDEFGHIVSVTINGAPNFVVIKDHVERQLIEVRPEQNSLPNGTRLIVQDGKHYREIANYIIDDAYVAPWLARHQELHRQLQAAGKTHKSS